MSLLLDHETTQTGVTVSPAVDVPSSDSRAAEPVLQPLEERIGPGRFPGIRRPFRSVCWLVHVAFGGMCLVLVLAILAAIPGLNILTLGYLIEPQRRVAESGRLRDGFPLMTLAPRLGIICFFGLLLLIPLRVQAVRVSDAAVILGSDSERVTQMRTVLGVMQVVVASHLLLAIARGGTVTCFLRPWKNFRWLLRTSLTRGGRREFSSGVEQILDSLQPVTHFWMGLKAFLGAVIWLIIPTGLLVAYSAPNRTSPLFGLLTFLGVLLMIPVAARLPLLQVHQAVTGKFRGIFAVSSPRQVIRSAPFSWLVTTVVLYLLTFPLYLAKVRLPPADALLLVTPIFIVMTYPARILVAWAYHRGMNRAEPAWFPLRWLTRIAMVPLLAGYAFFLFLTPTVSELGKAAPLENQAFLSPVPYAQWARREK